MQFLFQVNDQVFLTQNDGRLSLLYRRKKVTHPLPVPSEGVITHRRYLPHGGDKEPHYLVKFDGHTFPRDVPQSFLSAGK
jgi:hypothetical protein